jgi:hypothetical protein
MKNQHVQGGLPTPPECTDSGRRSAASVAPVRVDTTWLQFPLTRPGTPQFQILTVTQAVAGSVRVATDEPALFQLASDTQPHFGDSLTLPPQDTPLYVHVRYTPTATGVHHGRLQLEHAAGTVQVGLEGRTRRFPPFVGASADGSGKNMTFRKLLGVVLAFGGLLVSGYAFRCQLIPTWCDAPVVSEVSLPISSSPAHRPEEEPRSEAAVPAPVPKRTPAATRSLVAAPADRRSGTRRAPIRTAPEAPRQTPKGARVAAQARPKKASEESELERILNAKPNP